MPKDRAAALLAAWAAHVQAHGVTALPPFASDLAVAGAQSIEEDVATVREALLYPVREEMWQLCAPGDLSALDVDAETVSIRFASRLTERALAGLPGRRAGVDLLGHLRRAAAAGPAAGRRRRVDLGHRRPGPARRPRWSP